MFCSDSRLKNGEIILIFFLENRFKNKKGHMSTLLMYETVTREMLLKLTAVGNFLLTTNYKSKLYLHKRCIKHFRV